MGSQLHCVNCGISSLTFLPCPFCPDVQFCSTLCLIKNLEGAHKYECSMRLYGILRVVNKYVADSLSVGKLMALRLITQKSMNFFIKWRKDLEELLVNEDSNNVINRFTRDKIDGYYDLLNLSYTPVNAKQMERQRHFASALLWLLEVSGYFSELDQQYYSNELCMQIKSLLFRLLNKVDQYCISLILWDLIDKKIK